MSHTLAKQSNDPSPTNSANQKHNDTAIEPSKSNQTNKMTAFSSEAINKPLTSTQPIFTKIRESSSPNQNERGSDVSYSLSSKSSELQRRASLPKIRFHSKSIPKNFKTKKIMLKNLQKNKEKLEAAKSKVTTMFNSETDSEQSGERESIFAQILKQSPKREEEAPVKKKEPTISILSHFYNNELLNRKNAFNSILDEDREPVSEEPSKEVAEVKEEPKPKVKRTKIMEVDCKEKILNMHKNIKKLRHQTDKILRTEEDKYKVIFSQKDSLNCYHRLQVMPQVKNKKQEYIFSNPVLIDVVQNNVPVLCKVYIGDFVLPSVKFEIEEVEVWKYDERKNEGPKVKDETMKAKNKG